MLKSPWSTVPWSKHVFSLFTTDAAAARRNRPWVRKASDEVGLKHAPPPGHTHLLSHARCQQHVDAFLDGRSDFPVALRQVRAQRLPVDPATGETRRVTCASEKEAGINGMNAGDQPNAARFTFLAVVLFELADVLLQELVGAFVVFCLQLEKL